MTELEEAKAEVAACLSFLHTELAWEDFREDMLSSGSEEQSLSRKNFEKLYEFLKQTNHGLKFYRKYKELEEEVKDMQSTFDLRWKADSRAIRRWQAAHPGNELTWPDHADLVVWLMEQLFSPSEEVKSETVVADCPACSKERLHTDSEWQTYHPERGQGIDKIGRKEI